MITQAIIGGVLALGLVVLALGAIRRELAARQRAEQDLRAANEALEWRVRERTADLEHANGLLRQNEKRFRAYVSATADVIYRMSPDWSEMRQLQGQEFLADTTDSNHGWLSKYIYPDDQANVMRVIQEAIRTRSTFELEHRVRRADGTVGWTFSRAVPLLQADGAISEWFGAASDVTDRKQTELKLQSQLARLDLLSQITRAIGERQDVQSIFEVVIRSLEGHLPVDFCCVCMYEATENSLTVTRVGVQSQSLAIDLALPEQARIDVGENGLAHCLRGQLVYEPDLRQSSSSFPQRLARGGLSSMVAAPLVVESAVFGVLIAARTEPRSFSSGECEFLRQVSEHVALATHQVQLYQALQRAYEDLRQTQQAVMQQERLLSLGTMASGIAHDINNAISPIAIYTESLLERAPELTPQTRGNLEVIQRAIEDVAQTVARMREFYRAREVHQRVLPVDLNHLVLQVIELTRARWSDMAQQRGTVIEVLTQLAPDLPAIQGVEGELRDALTNLIFNAIDAMPSGGQVRVRTRLDGAGDELPAGSLIHLEVQDTGIGMDEETRRRCLEPFFTTKGERGTGLGLAMVYGALQRHDGEIAIQSAVGQGTTVRLSFPVPTADATGAATAEVVRVVAPLRILLVDDDPLVLKSVRDTLEADGHQVTGAEGGQAGIDAFMAVRAGAEPYQVVITDLGMPYVDGRKVASAIKSAAPGTLLLMLTGWGRQLLEHADPPPHVDGVLSKPPRLRALRRALARYRS